jgi:outer membrane protein OmpU
MRNLLLATTALVGLAALAPTAQAQTKDSPLNVNIGGYIDFRAGYFRESNDAATLTNPNATRNRRNHDFESEFKLNVDVDGKATRGIEYGGRVSLTNATTAANNSSGGSGIKTADAYVFLSGAYGKAILGDHNGASDLFVYAPTVGLGQVDGQYTNFTDPTSLAPFQPTFIENGSDYSTKVTYMTPQVGNDKHKVQLGVSYAPNSFKSGQTVNFNSATNRSDFVNAYRNNIEGAVQYQGNFSPVNVVLSANVQSAVGNVGGGLLTGGKARDYTAWGLGTQLSYAGFTVGGSYVDAGSFGTLEAGAVSQDKDQHTWTAGVKYEASKYAVAFSYLNGKGYNNQGSGQFGNYTGATSKTNYVKTFNAYALGATYTWFPGMATQADAVLFNQKREDVSNKNAGYVFVVSQKLTF